MSILNRWESMDLQELTLIEYLLCARHYAKYFPCILLCELVLCNLY